MITSTDYPPCVCGTGEEPMEQIATELTHTHYHHHPERWVEPVGTKEFDITHNHKHRHMFGFGDHHLVTKAREGKDE